MLLFRDLLDERLEDASFKSFFERECHICSVTIKLVALLEADPKKKCRVLEAQGISIEDYNDLKSGDVCDPEKVILLYRELGIPLPDKLKNCPRRK